MDEGNFISVHLQSTSIESEKNWRYFELVQWGKGNINKLIIRFESER